MASAPLMAPTHPQDDLFFSSDHKFALHGKIMMFFLLVSFALFQLYLLLFCVIKRAYSSRRSDPSDLAQPQDVADIMLKGIGESVYMNQPESILSHQQ